MRAIAAPSRCCSSGQGSRDPALAAIAEIVHDIDLKDGKFGRAEAEGIRTLIDGICSGNARGRGAPRARGGGVRRPVSAPSIKDGSVAAQAPANENWMAIAVT